MIEPPHWLSWVSDISGLIALVAFLGVPIMNWWGPKLKDWVASQSVYRRRKRIEALKVDLHHHELWHDEPMQGIRVTLGAIITGLICLAATVMLLVIIAVVDPPKLLRDLFLDIALIPADGMIAAFIVAYSFNKNIAFINTYKRKMTERIQKLAVGLPHEDRLIVSAGLGPSDPDTVMQEAGGAEDAR